MRCSHQNDIINGTKRLAQLEHNYRGKRPEMRPKHCVFDSRNGRIIMEYYLYNSLKMINQQSAARSTSSRKQHKIICQLRTNATVFFSQLAAANDQNSNGETRAPQQQQSTPSTPPIFLRRLSLLGEKNHPPRRYRDECMPLVSYRLLLQLRPSRGAA